MGFDFTVIAPLLPSHCGFSFVFGRGVSFLVSSSVFLSMIVQQLVGILVFSQERVRACPSTVPSWFLLPIYFTFGSVYMSMPLSHFVPAYPSPSLCPQVHSLVGLCLYSRLAPRFFRTFFFFLDSIYVLAYVISFSLSDLLHSV